jgi:hypothetical protein
LDGQPAKAEPAWQRLNDEYPNNQWNLKHQAEKKK